MDTVYAVIVVVFLLAGAGASVEYILKPRLGVRMAMTFGTLLAISLLFYFIVEEKPSVLPFIGGSVGFAASGTLFIIGSSWIDRKIKQSAIDRIAEFGRKDREPGQYY